MSFCMYDSKSISSVSPSVTFCLSITAKNSIENYGQYKVIDRQNLD